MLKLSLAHRRRQACGAALFVLASAAGVLGIPAAEAQPADLISVENATPSRRVPGLAPGDSVSLAFTLRNVWDSPVALRVGLDVEGAAAGLFDRETGLIVRVDECSRPWTLVPDPLTSAPTYRCDGRQTAVAGPAALGGLQGDLPLAEPGLAPGATASYRGIATLSPDAGNGFESSSLGTWRLVAVAEAPGREQSQVVSEVLGSQEGPANQALPASGALRIDPLWMFLAGLATVLGVAGLWFFLLTRRERGRTDH